jgi:translation elongation factor EF-Ts
MVKTTVGRKMTEKIQQYRKLVPEVREKTGAGFLQCLKGLYMCEGNVERAVAWVKEHPGFYI